jgi:hypothetical protein
MYNEISAYGKIIIRHFSFDDFFSRKRENLTTNHSNCFVFLFLPYIHFSLKLKRCFQITKDDDNFNSFTILLVDKQKK